MKISMLVLFTVLSTIGCLPTDSNAADRVTVETQQATYSRSQPVPTFDYSLERAVVIELYNARNTRVATHTVWRAASGVVEGDCPSIGYPIPYDTSMTNPLTSDSMRTATVEQAEPNGLFASHNSVATWVRCVVNGAEAPIYIESIVTTYPYPLTVDYENNRVRPANSAPPTVVINGRNSQR